MTGPAPDLPDNEPECPGIRVLTLEIDRSNTLVVVLTEQLGCPACGRAAERWVIPTFQDRMFHRRPDNPRPDPGE